MENNISYDYIEDYTMKCRLYPNKAQAERIDAAIYAVSLFHNRAVHDMFNGYLNTKEVKSSEKYKKEHPKCRDVSHFIDKKTLGNKAYKAQLIEEDPRIAECPAGAITLNAGVIADIERSMVKKQQKKQKKSKDSPKKSSKSKPDNKNGEKKKKTILPVENCQAHYYSKKAPRKSYTYQERICQVSFGDNDNVFRISLSKIGDVKVRGWNQNIRFDKDGLTTFKDYCESASKKDVFTIVVSKDNCGDYWICFKLHKCVYKPCKKTNNSGIGIDVGIKDLVICSDGTKYENKRFNQKENDHVSELNRQMSRRYGWKNPSFRGDHKKDRTITPSKRYLATQLKSAKLKRKIRNRRNWYNNNVTKDIINNHDMVAIESLSVKEMLSGKNKRLHFLLQDAAMSEVLEMIRYKGEWHGRTVREIGRYEPSTKLCSKCGYKYEDITLSVRNWTCPHCGAHHDRDVNAAKNIYMFALKQGA